MKKLLVSVLGFLLVCGTILPQSIFAAEKATVINKDESIYVTLDQTGAEKEAYIVNTFEVGRAGIVTDYGQYSHLKNLTNTTELSQENGKVQFEADLGKFYYQGALEQYELPWDIQITYFLNGKELTPEQLLGKDGHLEMNISLRKNKQADSTFFENYVVQVAVPLHADVFSKIKAKDAVMANVGKDKQATYTLMPEKNETYVIEADVENFEMEGIEFSAMPFTMAFDTPDVEDMKSEMMTLADAINDVHEGVGEFRNGIGSLYDGMGQLKNGSSAFKNGMNELSQSSTSLVGGSNEISAVLNEMNESLDVLDEFELPDTKDIEAGFQSALSYLKEVKSGVDDTVQNNEQVMGELQGVLDEIQATDISEEDWQMMIDGGVDEEVVSTLRSTYEAALQLNPVVKDVDEAFNLANQQLKEIAGYLTETISELEEQGAEITQLVNGMDAAKDLQQLKDGVHTFVAGYSEFHNGLLAYTKGVNQLAANYKEIDDGIAGTQNGIGDLQTGANSLYDGTKKLNDATSELPEQMTKEIDELLAEYDKSDFKPVSFMSKKNKQMDVVQFVIKTEEIKQEVVKSRQVDKEEKKTIWQRFLDLFR